MNYYLLQESKQHNNEFWEKTEMFEYFDDALFCFVVCLVVLLLVVPFVYLLFCLACCCLVLLVVIAVTA